MTALEHRFIALENRVHRLLVRHSIAALRVSVGLVFLGFGFLKYFPGVSPAEGLVTDATDVLFLGLIPSAVATYVVATMECFIGICFLIGAGSLMRVAIWVLAAHFVGLISPLAIEPAQLFSGPSNAPTLEGQYVLKDIILAAAGMVIAAGTFRGGRMVRDEPQVHPFAATAVMGAERKLEIVLAATNSGRAVETACREQGISEADFYEWRDVTLTAAARALHGAPGSPSTDVHLQGTGPPPKRAMGPPSSETVRATPGRSGTTWLTAVALLLLVRRGLEQTKNG